MEPGFATNCTELSEKRSESLILSGLDTLICSIDGITKETQESIRVGSNYEEIIRNVINFLQLRNEYLARGFDKPARVIIRFIKQRRNQHEWDEFQKFWLNLLDSTHKDTVVFLRHSRFGQ